MHVMNKMINYVIFSFQPHFTLVQQCIAMSLISDQVYPNCAKERGAG